MKDCVNLQTLLHFRFEVDYGISGSNPTSQLGQNQELSHWQNCQLEHDEWITEIAAYFGHLLVGIRITTNKKTCGPWGKVMDQLQINTFSGGKLMYIYGMIGDSVDQFGAAFWIC